MPTLGDLSLGFAEHVDHHDVVVVQLEGGEGLDSGSQRWKSRSSCLDIKWVSRKMSLQPFDWPKVICFCPARGLAHSRGTAEVATAHLSFGLQPLTALHWLSAMRSELMDELDWRREIPYDAAGSRTLAQGAKGFFI